VDHLGDDLVPTEQELPGLIAAYQVLVTRWSVHNDVLWRIIGFSLAAEVSAFVGLLSVGRSPGIHIILGCATAAVGIVGPINTRYAETGILMDRTWLDRYERTLLPRFPHLRQLHGDKLLDRIADWKKYANERELMRMSERRFGGSPAAPTLNRAFDLIGQPSLIWTSIMALGGAVGFDIGIIVGVNSTLWVWILCTVTNVVMVALWLLASSFFDKRLSHEDPKAA
jgi:hypothetical protein